MTATQTSSRKTQPTAVSVRPLDVTVLAGGPSAEREVSLDSGRSVHAALTRLGHVATIHDVGPDNLAALDRPVDFVFIALHGEFGEDGTVQAELDARGVRYSGSGAAASRLAMDKAESKRCFLRAGVPTPDFEVVDALNRDEVMQRFALPAVVKPVASGSSVDTYIVRARDELRARIDTVIASHGAALLERFVAGPELTVGILGDEALPVCEIRTHREFYDYDAKYERDDTQYLFDIDLPDETLRQVREWSLTAYSVLGVRHLCRVDFMVDGLGRPWFI
ncbi:MAG: D-alanine--D-alanine ligase, partial [Planctomycetes bacterium]|nr:D-alanine--D-alanine ligase [Planctomycetota bacterium]